MKTIRVLLIICLALVMCGSGWAASAPSEGVVGENGEVLAQLKDVAGNGAYAMEEGLVGEASFRLPHGLAFLPDGSLLVSDTRNQLIRRIDGEAVSVYAGFPFAPLDEYQLPLGALLDGQAEESTFNRPQGLAVDAEGNVYVADTENHAIRKITVTGEVLTIAGDGVRGYHDGSAEEARFLNPTGLAVANDGTLYVADSGNHVIRKINTDGQVSTLNAVSERIVEVAEGVVAPAGDHQDGALGQAMFNEPHDVVIDEQGNLYVSDTGNRLIRYIDLQTNTVSTVAGYIPADGERYKAQDLYASGGFVDGTANEARFASPRGLALTSEGGLVIADSLNHAIRYLHNGRVTTLAGSKKGISGDQNGVNGHQLLYHPVGVAVDAEGNLYIADTFNHKVKVWSLYRMPELPETNEINVVNEQELLSLEVAPQVVNGRTMVPVRTIVESFGYHVEYEESVVTFSDDSRSVQLQIGHHDLLITSDDGQTSSVLLDAVPYVDEGRTFVPLRLLSEAFDLDVDWHSASKTVILRQAIY